MVLVRTQCHMIRESKRYICAVNQTVTDVVTVVGFSIKRAVTPNDFSTKLTGTTLVTKSVTESAIMF